MAPDAGRLPGREARRRPGRRPPRDRSDVAEGHGRARRARGHAEEALRGTSRARRRAGEVSDGQGDRPLRDRRPGGSVAPVPAGRGLLHARPRRGPARRDEPRPGRHAHRDRRGEGAAVARLRRAQPRDAARGPLPPAKGRGPEGPRRRIRGRARRGGPRAPRELRPRDDRPGGSRSLLRARARRAVVVLLDLGPPPPAAARVGQREIRQGELERERRRGGAERSRGVPGGRPRQAHGARAQACEAVEGPRAMDGRDSGRRRSAPRRRKAGAGVGALAERGPAHARRARGVSGRGVRGRAGRPARAGGGPRPAVPRQGAPDDPRAPSRLAGDLHRAGLPRRGRARAVLDVRSSRGPRRGPDAQDPALAALGAAGLRLDLRAHARRGPRGALEPLPDDHRRAPDGRDVRHAREAQGVLRAGRIRGQAPPRARPATSSMPSIGSQRSRTIGAPPFARRCS